MAIGRPPRSRVVITVIKTIAVELVFLSLIFVPAGTFNWPEAWVLLLLYLSFVSGMVIWMKKKDPELLKERMSTRRGVKAWDKKIIIVYTALLIIMLIVIGLDSVRLRWSQVPLLLKALGFSGYIPGAILIFSAMVHNAYLSQMVRIQKDRGQQVCTTGPYKFIRHPMYAGIIICVLCLPFSLGSFYALVVAALIALLFILRTSLEDKTLRKELPGYQEYSSRVHYKLIPGVW